MLAVVVVLIKCIVLDEPYGAMKDSPVREHKLRLSSKIHLLIIRVSGRSDPGSSNSLFLAPFRLSANGIRVYLSQFVPLAHR